MLLHQVSHFNVGRLDAYCAALVGNIAFTYGLANYDLNNGHGPQPYRGKITLSGGITAAQAAQVLHYMCREASTSTINGVAGWKYRALNGAYTPNDKFPFGSVAGGTWFVEKGWFVEGVGSGFSLLDDNGVIQAPPVTSGISVGNLVAGEDSLLVARYDSATGYALKNEYTLNGAHSSGTGTVTINEAIKPDTPTSGSIRLGDYHYAYSSFAGHVFTLTSALAENHASGSYAWVPLIDKAVVAASTESVSFLYNADFVAYIEVRNGNGATGVMKEYLNTQPMGVGLSALNVVRIPE
ncbi:MAG: hypothetical protein HY306_02770 [Nitrosomonadales bacterium]|nr:hypothetical protein [Nitrosomonadales bacterium]